MNRKADSNIGQRIKELRKERGLTQKKLAEELNLSISTIIGYENGLREPNSIAMQKLEKFFGVNASYLHGNVNKDEFLSFKNLVNDDLDNLIDTFISFKEVFQTAELENQHNSVEVINSVLTFTINNILFTATTNIDSKDFIKLIESLKNLNYSGVKELIKRSEELCYVDKYRNT